MQIAFSAAAARQWLKLSADVRQGDVKRLKGRAGARLRVGDWRVVFYIEGDTIVVAAVGHRREVYD